ncbi:hypothetical protein CAPTEDRAFT_219970 [Capitella teleta]|uniref:Ig-like domain-containing protein n=1 Tax=Capitella teleta TaxID=283909 RepID=R7UGI0_CAPTE|nr:hypothetical protein CAPTEDRAFT_219970 [Capitella teleta]|eukprot:ELU05193.1 hypothetical protein CAPTEDRAFT_219970 [Capitella teleta]
MAEGPLPCATCGRYCGSLWQAQGHQSPEYDPVELVASFDSLASPPPMREVPPTVIQGKTTQTLNIQEGGTAVLTCDATGYPMPNITWVRANGAALPDPINKFSIKTKMLRLENLKREDRGVYRCLADNNVRPPATYDATLYVDFRPHARYVQSTYGQAQNRLFDLTIECIVSGFPAPDLKWYKRNGVGKDLITDDEKHVIHALLNHGQTLSISEVWYQLTIINVQANDYGEYLCEGENRLGFHEASVIVYETSECQGPNCPPEGGVVAGATALVAMPTLLLFLAALQLS